jgi:hypothetical protein
MSCIIQSLSPVLPQAPTGRLRPKILFLPLSATFDLSVSHSLFFWLVADGSGAYCWLIAGGWFILREKYYCLVADKPNEHAVSLLR